MARIFLSYSRSNSRAIGRLAGAIRELDFEVWLDMELKGGQDWWDGVLAKIKGSDYFMIAAGADTLDSAACVSELHYASSLGKIILPVSVGLDISKSNLPEELSKIQYVDYRLRNLRRDIHLAAALNSLPEPPEIPIKLPPIPGLPHSEKPLMGPIGWVVMLLFMALVLLGFIVVLVVMGRLMV